MDDLDLLKQKWQSVEQELPKLSYTDIHQMLLKKSSSIVKWIFLISIAELLFWTICNYRLQKDRISYDIPLSLQKAISSVAEWDLLFLKILFLCVATV